MCTHYEALGVAESIAAKEVPSAFRRKALSVHPDKGGSKEAFQLVLTAFETLVDPVRRERYDHSLRIARDLKHPRHLADVPRKRPRMNCTKTPEAGGKVEVTIKGVVTSGRLFELLRELRPANRAAFLSQQLTENERLDLEAWAKYYNKHQRDGANQNSPTIAKHYSQPSSGNGNNSQVCDESSEEASTSSSTQDEDDGTVLFAVCDIQNSPYEAEARPRTCHCASGGPRRNSGISKKVNKSGIYYNAEARLAFIILSSKYTSDLSVAVDHLLLLNNIKQRMLECKDATLDKRLDTAVHTTFQECNTTCDKWGLGIRFRVRKHFWVGANALRTPTMHSLPQALAAIRRLLPFQWGAGYKGINALAEKSLVELQDDWQNFRSTYLSICEEGGWQRTRIEANLKSLVEMAAPRREHTLELWNRAAMSREDSARHGGGPREAAEERAWRLALKVLCTQRRRAAHAAKAAARAKRIEEAVRRASMRASSAQQPAYKDLTFEEILNGTRARGELQ